MPDDFKVQYSLNDYVNFVVILNPGSIGLVKYIRRVQKEKISSKGEKCSHGPSMSRYGRITKIDNEDGSTSKLNDQVTGTPIMRKNEMRTQNLCFACKSL